MNNYKTVVLFCLVLLVSASGFSQDTNLSSKEGTTTLGLGMGLPYGGVGIRIGTNLSDGFNLFGSLGYQLAGVGYNLGLRKDFGNTSMTQFYMLAMYGTNAAIKIIDLSEYDKVYTGATVGAGVKVNSRRKEGNYWDFGLLLPFRSSSYERDFKAADNDPRVGEFVAPWPVLITVGYNFKL